VAQGELGRRLTQWRDGFAHVGAVAGQGDKSSNGGGILVQMAILRFPAIHINIFNLLEKN
jgi:hypothetical protein